MRLTQRNSRNPNRIVPRKSAKTPIAEESHSHGRVVKSLSLLPLFRNLTKLAIIFLVRGLPGSQDTHLGHVSVDNAIRDRIPALSEEDVLLRQAQVSGVAVRACESRIASEPAFRPGVQSTSMSQTGVSNETLTFQRSANRLRRVQRASFL